MTEDQKIAINRFYWEVVEGMKRDNQSRAQGTREARLCQEMVQILTGLKISLAQAAEILGEAGV